MISFTPLCWYTAHLLAAFILSNILFFTNILLIHSLTLKVFNSLSFAFTATLCFVFSPSGIFMYAFYSESLFLTIALTGMILRENRRIWLSAIIFGMSTLVRSNGYLFAGFFIFDAIRSKRVAFKGWVWTWMKAFACVTIVGELACEQDTTIVRWISMVD